MAVPDRDYSRGALAKAAGVNGETVRFYEKVGLMPPPKRAANGYRVYDRADLKRLVFIRRARELGFGNAEIADLLDMSEKRLSCDEVKARALANAALISAKMDDLEKMRDALMMAAAECRGGTAPDCALIDRLFED